MEQTRTLSLSEQRDWEYEIQKAQAAGELTAQEAVAMRREVGLVDTLTSPEHRGKYVAAGYAELAGTPGENTRVVTTHDAGSFLEEHGGIGFQALPSPAEQIDLDRESRVANKTRDALQLWSRLCTGKFDQEAQRSIAGAFATSEADKSPQAKMLRYFKKKMDEHVAEFSLPWFVPKGLAKLINGDREKAQREKLTVRQVLTWFSKGDKTPMGPSEVAARLRAMKEAVESGNASMQSLIADACYLPSRDAVKAALVLMVAAVRTSEDADLLHCFCFDMGKACPFQYESDIQWAFVEALRRGVPSSHLVELEGQLFRRHKGMGLLALLNARPLEPVELKEVMVAISRIEVGRYGYDPGPNAFGRLLEAGLPINAAAKALPQDSQTVQYGRDDDGGHYWGIAPEYSEPFFEWVRNGAENPATARALIEVVPKFNTPTIMWETLETLEEGGASVTSMLAVLRAYAHDTTDESVGASHNYAFECLEYWLDNSSLGEKEMVALLVTATSWLVRKLADFESTHDEWQDRPVRWTKTGGQELHQRYQQIVERVRDSGLVSPGELAAATEPIAAGPWATTLQRATGVIDASELLD